MKVNDENSRIRDPLVRGMDPRIRIHNKLSWIRNTEKYNTYYYTCMYKIVFW